MKILHMLQSSRFSGAENVVCQIIKMFDKEDIEFVYCSPDGQIREALLERGINFFPLKKCSVSEFKRAVKSVKPDIIHAHDMRASLFSALTGGSIPLISHIHGNNIDLQRRSFKSILYFLAARKADHIFWVSNSTYESFAFYNKVRFKSSVLYNIISVNDLYEKMKKDKRTYDYDVIFLGRLSYPKNPRRIIDVIDLVKKSKPDIKAAIVGTGEIEQEIRQLVKEKNLSDNVDFMGFQNNPYKILHDSKVMLMTSRWEGTPMCALEALSLCVPIVSTPTDGLCDLIENGVNGFLSDSDSELADKILYIVRSPEVRERLSGNAYQKGKSFNDADKYKAEIYKAYYHTREKSIDADAV